MGILYNKTREMMKKENPIKLLLELFITFFKVGLLTFGGGYAMVPIIQREVSEKKKWIPAGEILDILAISESTPGPIAINTATYVGFRVMGFWGSFFATLGLIIPSFGIIFVISLFYKQFMTWHVVAAAFKGLKIGVIILLVMVVFKLSKAVKKDLFTIILFCLTLIGMLVITFFQIKIPSVSIIFIVLGLIVGIIATAITRKEKK